jgi:hypothetical protein
MAVIKVAEIQIDVLSMSGAPPPKHVPGALNVPVSSSSNPSKSGDRV